MCELALLYLSPIKALLNNLEIRLRQLFDPAGLRVTVWHGDIGQGKRRRITREPPSVLLATPESLEVVLVSRRVDRHAPFATLRAVVVDEIHAFAGDDRGWHMLALLERIGRLANEPLQRVELSATLGNPQQLLAWFSPRAEADRLVVGPEEPDRCQPDVQVDHVGTLDNAATVNSRLHRGEKRLVFCDSRSQVERLASGLRERNVRTFVSHSSLSPEERNRAESAFATERDCVIVATSTLELGIGVGDLDRVIQIDAPHSVAGFPQRLGRSTWRDWLPRFPSRAGISDADAEALVTYMTSSGYLDETD